MLRILAPTDLSTASLSGLRFAIQWSRQQRAEIIFMHVLHIPRPTVWSDNQFNAFADAERTRFRTKLDKFIAKLLHGTGMKYLRHTNLILEGISPETAITDYCGEHPEIGFICIGTRGAGKIKKIFGTHTGNLITHSPVPVIAVQKGYRMRPISNFLYASDLCNYKAELQKVVAVAGPLKAKIDILHFTQPGEVRINREVIEKVFKDEFRYDVHFNFKTTETTGSLVVNLQREVIARRPSAVIMFTDQDRSLFEKIFFPSRTERVSFHLKAPLLVFGKWSRI